MEKAENFEEHTKDVINELDPHVKEAISQIAEDDLPDPSTQMYSAHEAHNFIKSVEYFANNVCVPGNESAIELFVHRFIHSIINHLHKFMNSCRGLGQVLIELISFQMYDTTGEALNSCENNPISGPKLDHMRVLCSTSQFSKDLMKTFKDIISLMENFDKVILNDTSKGLPKQLTSIIDQLTKAGCRIDVVKPLRSTTPFPRDFATTNSLVKAGYGSNHAAIVSTLKTFRTDMQSIGIKLNDFSKNGEAFTRLHEEIKKMDVGDSNDSAKAKAAAERFATLEKRLLALQGVFAITYPLYRQLWVTSVYSPIRAMYTTQGEHLESDDISLPMINMSV